MAIADDAPATEDPAQVAVGTDDPVFDFIGVAAAVERVAKAGDHAVAICRMAQRTDHVDRHAVARRLEAHDPEELGGAPHALGREIDAPDADPADSSARASASRWKASSAGRPLDASAGAGRTLPSEFHSRRAPSSNDSGLKVWQDDTGDTIETMPRCKMPGRALRAPWRQIVDMLAGLIGCLALLSIGHASAGTGLLVINSNNTDPAPRAAWQVVVDRFQRENPDLSVELNVYDHESYKKAIRGWLTSAPPDVVFWFAGNRMRQFVTPGLLEDLSDLYDADARARMHPSALELVSQGGRQFGVPYTYYQVGLYYRRDVLEAAGIAEAPLTFGGTRRRLRQAQGRRHRAVRDRHARPVAGRRVVRLSRPARERPRLPHGADAGIGRLYRSAGARRIRSLADAARSRLLQSTTTRRRAGSRARRSCTRARQR